MQVPSYPFSFTFLLCSVRLCLPPPHPAVGAACLLRHRRISRRRPHLSQARPAPPTAASPRATGAARASCATAAPPAAGCEADLVRDLSKEDAGRAARVVGEARGGGSREDRARAAGGPPLAAGRVLPLIAGPVAKPTAGRVLSHADPRRCRLGGM